MKAIVTLHAFAFLVLALAGCRPIPQLVIPATPDGLACWRQCQQTFYTCKGSYRPPTTDAGAVLSLLSGDPCVGAEQSCLSTCPGAYMSNGPPPPPVYVPPVSQAAKPIAHGHDGNLPPELLQPIPSDTDQQGHTGSRVCANADCTETREK